MEESTPDFVPSKLLSLPPEVLEHIFCQQSLQGKDLCYLSRTCSLFKGVINSNELWKEKFKQRWPQTFLKVKAKSVGSHVSWEAMYRERILSKYSVTMKLDELAQLTYTREAKALKAENEGKFYNFPGHIDNKADPSKSNFEATDFKWDFSMCELLEIYHSGDSRCNLTRRYYAEKSLWYMRQQELRIEIERFLAQPDSVRDIELGAVLIAQWFQPTALFTCSDIKKQFDDLAQLVKNVLMELFPTHSCLSESSACTTVGNLSSSLWSAPECRQILQAIEMVIKPMFNNIFKKYFVQQNSFINLVLQDKKGIPLTLCLTVKAVAQRLGLLLEPVSFPRHFLLRWREHEMKIGLDQYTFVDPFNGNYSMTFQDLTDAFSMSDFHIIEQHCNKCPTQEVLERMLRNLTNLGRHAQTNNGIHLLRHATELHSIFSPAEVEMAIFSMQIKVQLRVNLLSVINALEEMRDGQHMAMTDILSDLQHECERLLFSYRHAEPKPRPAKLRRNNPQVKFSVGMVMQHKLYNYICVIYGWDSSCEASSDWVLQMGVNRLERKCHQPFYHVYVMDGTDRYAAEENLLFTANVEEITHPEVGAVFERFNGQCYEPNRMLQEVYPDDLEVSQQLMTEFLSSQQEVGRPV